MSKKNKKSKRSINHRQIVFDMDGTLFDLYGVPEWLPKLRAEDASPYLEAAPMWNMEELHAVLTALRKVDYRLAVNSWLSMQSSEDYKKRVRQAKRESLRRHLPVMFDEIHLVAYGTPKTKPMRYGGGILIDDNAEVRAQWERAGGRTIDPTTENIIEALAALLGGEDK